MTHILDGNEADWRARSDQIEQERIEDAARREWAYPLRLAWAIRSLDMDLRDSPRPPLSHPHPEADGGVTVIQPDAEAQRRARSLRYGRGLPADR